MTAIMLKGAPVAAAMNIRTAEMVRQLEQKGVKPCLALVRVGRREDDIAYEKGIIKRCAAVGLELRSLELEESITTAELMAETEKLNADRGVHGILIFMPLPGHIDEAAVRSAIAAEKDVDGVTQASAASVFTGAGRGFAPCTARAVVEILKHYDIAMAGKRAAVFGRSLVIGRPVSMLLMRENATVTICHSRTENGPEIARQADIIVAALGKARGLGKEYFSPGQAVIDVGINFDGGKMCGDTDFEAAALTAAAVTPVPGGVGAVTTAVLARHVAEAAEKIFGDRQSI